MSEATVEKFRVVIVGGGPVGLCLAHSLTLAGIDYVLLESRDSIVEQSGFGLLLWPHGVRILDQIGLLDEGRKVYLPMKDKSNHWPDGSEIACSDLYSEIERNHGHPIMLFQRQKLLELLYDHLPEKEKRLLTKKKVVSIEKQDRGVTVRCSDGTTVEGSIVVGCDGVRSTVRHTMRDMMLEASARGIDGDSPMTARYQLLAGHVDRIDDMEPGHIWETRSDKMSMQCFMLEEEGWFLAYKRLDKPYDKTTRYTDKDAEAFASSLLDCPVSPDKKFKDFWSVRRWFRLLDLEEGFIKNWHWDRMVLVGDSVHKMTPNLGLGLNQGWQGVAALTNILHKLLATDVNPDTKTIEKAFAEYKATTERMANDSMSLSKSYTRITAWDNLFYKAADYILPYVGGDSAVMKLLVSPVVRKGIVLDFVPEKGLVQGKIKWINSAPKDD